MKCAIMTLCYVNNTIITNKMSEELNPREYKFVQEYLTNGYNGRRAYMVAYENDNENTSGVEACKMLKKEKIKRALNDEEGGFRELARIYGADKKSIVQKLVALIFEKETRAVTKNGKEEMVELDRDGKEVIQAINTLAKLTGDFAPEKKEVKIDDEKSKIDTSNMTPEELEEAKNNILKEL